MTPRQELSHDQPVRTRRGLVPHRQPGPVRRGVAAPGRRPVRSRSPRRSTTPTPSRATVVWKPVLTDADAIRRIALEANADDRCVGVIAWMHTFSPGQDVDRRPRRAAQAAAAPAHAGQRRAALGRDRHGLHEPQPGRPRRPRVRLHPDPDRRRPQDRRRPRQRPGRHRRGSATGCAPPPARRAMRTLRLARFGDNMRDVAVTEGDKVEAELRFGVSVNTYGVNDLVAGVDAATDSDVDTLVEAVRGRVRRRPGAARRRRAARVAALRRPHRARACARSSRTAGSPRSPPTSRTSAGCGSCPGSPCSG